MTEKTTVILSGKLNADIEKKADEMEVTTVILSGKLNADIEKKADEMEVPKTVLCRMVLAKWIKQNQEMIGEVIIRAVKPHGNGAYIYCPKRWVGYVIRAEVKRKVKG